MQVSDNTRKMGLKKDLQLVTDEFIRALQDEGVACAIGSIFEAKLKEEGVAWAIGNIFEDKRKAWLQELQGVKRGNNSLKVEWKNANEKIEKLHAYNRRYNIIVTGLVLASYSEASSTIPTDDVADNDVTELSSSISSEKAFLDL